MSSLNRLAIALLLSMLLPGSPRPVEACNLEVTVEEPASENLTEVEEKVELLWHGSAEERQAIVEEVYSNFQPVFSGLEGEDRQSAQEIVKSLRLWLQAEREDWIASRLLAGLATFSSELFNPLFEDALDHRSPNIRWRGIQHFVSQRSAEVLEPLTRIRKREKRRWIRVDTALALACQGSMEALADLRPWMNSDNAELVGAVIGAYATADADVGLEPVLALARKGPESTRARAVAAIKSWPESEMALDALLEISRSEDDGLRGAAIDALVAFDDERAIRAIVDAALDQDFPRRGFGPIFALSRAPRSPAIRAALRKASSALEPLWTETLAAVTGVTFEEMIEKGAAGFGESRNRVGGPAPPDKSACPFQPLNLDPTLPGDVLISPPEGLESVRCYRAPGLEGAPDLKLRLRRDEDSYVEDLFESSSGQWLMVENWSVNAPCWIASDVVVASTEEEDQLEDRAGPSALFVVELDIPAEELGDDGAGALLDGGLLRVVDNGSRSVGVRLAAGRGDARAFELLVASLRYDDRLLDYGLLVLIEELEPYLTDDVELDSVHDYMDRADDDGPYTEIWDIWYDDELDDED